MRKLLFLLVAFGLVLATGVLGYRYLSKQVIPQVPLAVPSQEESAAGGEGSQPEEPEKIPAPDFTAYDADGNEVKLSDQLGAVPVVLNFWASWCPPCRMEMPDFDKVAAEYADDTLRFLMVDMIGTGGSYTETREKAQEYITGEGFTFTVWFDENQEALTTYGINSFPTTVFINTEGNVEGAYRGAMSEETLRLFLQQLYGL